MPIYEYVCAKCGQKTEVIQRMGDAPLKVCPHCGGRLKKAISAPAIQFKGSGWYVTDYARAKKESGSSAKADADGGDGDKEKSAEKTEKTEKSVDSGKVSKSEKPSSKSDKKKS